MRSERRRGRFRRLLLFLILIAILGGGIWYFGTAWILRGGVRESIDGDFQSAARSFQRAGSLGRGARAGDGLAVNALLNGSLEDAEQRIEIAKGNPPWRSSFDPDEVLERLNDSSAFLRAVLYGEYASSFKDDPEFKLGRVEASIGALRLSDAARLLDEVGDRVPYQKRAREFRDRMERLRSQGHHAFVLDRRGEELVVRPLKDGPDQLLEPAAASLWGGSHGPGLEKALSKEDRYRKLYLSVDARVQQAATAALSGDRGEIAVIDPRNGEILALAALGSDGLPASLGLSFEPGSVLKPITLATAYTAGLDVDAMFPLDCRRPDRVEDKLFYDWMAHGTVRDESQAMAVSCNLFFQRLGRAAGATKLKQELFQFGFGREAAYTPLELRFGSVKEGGGAWYLATTSVGLENVTMTSLHGAWIASVFASGGKGYIPRLILGAANRNGELRKTEDAPSSENILDPDQARRIASTMLEVVENEEGTGRRARVAGLSLALKSGTSGSREAGYDAVMLGFAPYENPRLAFCIYAPNAGRAEIAAARVVRALLEPLVPLLASETSPW